MTPPRILIGTRSSALARWQANWVAAQLISAGVDVELVPIATRGDTQSREPITELGSPGVFTKELQRALLDGRIDLAVHSLKDLPTDEVENVVLAAVPERESPHDALIARDGQRLDQLPRGAAIGTGSLRRRAQLLHVRRDLQMRDIRGNVDTRLKKLAAGEYDALVLAQAGLKRLGLEAQITQLFEPDVLLPAVGQGALGIEARADDAATRAAIAPVDDPASRRAVLAERAMLAALAGGCLAPVGGWAHPGPDGQLRLDAVVLSADGQRRIAAGATATWGTVAWDTATDGDAVRLGRDVADKLLAQGAAELIRQSREGMGEV